MTIGQRIAQKRKELALSQEALGDQLGVSRQSIYKWESDTALPEIDKLIALSRLYGVSVGWLLGVEDLPEPPGEAAGTEAALTEQQLRMVEEIASRYIAAQPKPRKRRRWPFVAAGLILCLVLFHLFDRLGRMDDQYADLQNSVYRVESSVNGQIGSLSSRVEEILKAQNSLVADYHVELVGVWPENNTATFSAYAVPKTYVAGMSVEFLAENGKTASDQLGKAGEEGSNQRFSATISVPLSDHITLSALLILPDGTRQTQLLDQFEGLYSDSLPQVDVHSELVWMELEDGDLMLEKDDHERYVYIREIEPDAEQPAAAAANIQVGLFKNQKLVAWAEPCETPDSFHGFEEYDFYRLPELQLPVSPQDTLQVAAVVTDVYGRQGVYSDIPCVLEDGELTWPATPDLSDHDPAHWQYGG